VKWKCCFVCEDDVLISEPKAINLTVLYKLQMHAVVMIRKNNFVQGQFFLLVTVWGLAGKKNQTK